jgi:prolyl 4-hydroxylase
MFQQFFSFMQSETTRDEQSVQTIWNGLVDDVDWNIEFNTLIDGKEIFLVQNFLNQEECKRIIQASEGFGYGKTMYPKSYRGNLRLITTDTSLAQSLWTRLEKIVPPVVEENGHQWRPIGLNEVWRLSKYLPGDRFKSHVDACFQRRSDEKSMFTVNVYLNGIDEFTGGSTRFYDDHEEKKVEATIQPSCGLCVLFRQPHAASYLHDGEEVQSGVKYLLRSDVMYTKICKNE